MDNFCRTIIVKLQLDQIMVINCIMGYIYLCIYMYIITYLYIYIYANISYQGEHAHTPSSYVSKCDPSQFRPPCSPGPFFQPPKAQGAVGMTHDRRNWVM